MTCWRRWRARPPARGWTRSSSPAIAIFCRWLTSTFASSRPAASSPTRSSTTRPRWRQKYGLRPDQLVDLKALVGDKSDNIPGVRGIGEKGATDLLQKYGTLDAVYEHLDEVKPDRARNALTEGRESAELSHRLGQIITAVPVQLDLAACRTRDYDRAQVVALFQDLAFRSLVEKLPATRRHGDTETRRHGDTETRRHGDGGAVGAVRVRGAGGPIYPSASLPIYQLLTPRHHRARTGRTRREAGRRVDDRLRHRDHRHRSAGGGVGGAGGRVGADLRGFRNLKGLFGLHPGATFRRDQPALGNGPRGAAADLR